MKTKVETIAEKFYPSQMGFSSFGEPEDQHEESRRSFIHGFLTAIDEVEQYLKGETASFQGLQEFLKSFIKY